MSKEFYNPFELYSSYPEEAKIATDEISSCINIFMGELEDIMNKHCKVGASDTASREAIYEYIIKEKFGWRL